MQETVYSLPVPLSIALVADLHDHPYSAVLSSLQNHKPDIICIAGDFTHGGFPASGLKMENTRYSLSFLSACNKKALPQNAGAQNVYRYIMLNKADYTAVQANSLLCDILLYIGLL